MARKKTQKNGNGNGKSKSSRFDDLHLETKKTALGVIFLAFGVLTALSYFQLAGRFGSYFYSFFDLLLGVGFFLIPLVFFAVAGIFFLSHRTNLYFSTMFGAVLFLATSLSFMEILTGTTRAFGGYVGFGIAYPVSAVFGFWGGVVVLSAGILVSLGITFNISFKNLLAFFMKKEESEPEERELKVFEAMHGEEAPTTPRSQGASGAGTPTPAKRDGGKAKDDLAAAGLKMDLAHKALRQKIKWEMPPLSLLEKGGGKPEAGDIKVFANIIQKTLADFGIDVEMGEVSIGPAVTQYTLKPAQGIKLSKITALHNDLALALAAHPLRIEAPIPGKSLVGIEIPNRTIALVRMRGLLENEAFVKNPAPLIFPLGIDVAGKIIYSDLGKMPHVLIAGSTGSGKSVAIHSLLVSFLYHNSPETLRLILIDPKRVELTLYSGIPHLLSDVITDAKKSVMALRWAAKEMDRRYEVLSSSRVRDIDSYNNMKIKEKDGEIMPYLIIVVDELADLMTTYPREVEASIVRLAQMSRAVGIHLVISTQRPSVEVITGLIKANIPSRIAFSTTSQIDSRTILDGSGAEKLLGRGDMLFLAGDAPRSTRIQGGYVTEEEVKKLADYLKRLGIEDKGIEEEGKLDAFLNSKQGGEGGSILAFNDDGEGDDDEMYEEARALVLEAGKASASYLQRRLKVGYARAARLLDVMEEKGIIGPADGAKPREVIGGGASRAEDDSFGEE